MKPSGIRQLVAAHLAEMLPEWHLARQVYDLFPHLETHQYQHQTYAIGLLDTNPAPGRQRPSDGMVATTTLGVRIACRLRADAGATDYDRALDSEADMAAALAMLKTAETNIGLRILQIGQREVTDDGTVYLSEIQCSVAHIYPIELPAPPDPDPDPDPEDDDD